MINLISRLPISDRRRARQRGNELIEFALWALLMMPFLIGTFIVGMNLLRMIQCQEIGRDIGNQYIHGVDYSTYQAQQVAARLGQGYGLQIGSSFSGNEANNDSNGGNAYVLLSQVMYVGTGTCASDATCTNKNHYVFTQRIGFGEKTIQFNGVQVQSALGNPALTLSTGGFVENNILDDTTAQCTSCSGFWTTQLTDGQVAYIVEAFFADPGLNFSAYPSGGIYVRAFF